MWYCRGTMRTDEGGITEYGGGKPTTTATTAQECPGLAALCQGELCS